MAIVTGILTTLEVLEQFNAVYNSTDPLLIRFRNGLNDKPFVFEFAGNLKNMGVKNIPSPYIPAGSVADLALTAGSWSDAAVQVEYRAQTNGKQYRIQLNYDWTAEHEADITLSVHNEGKAPQGAEITKGKKSGEDVKAIRHTAWKEFDIMLVTTGKLVELVVMEKGII